MGNLTQTQKLLIIGLVLWFLFYGGGTPVPVTPTKPTAVTYIYEKDDGSVPPPVASAISKLNEQDIVATVFEEDTLDAEGQVPDQYKVSLPAARTAGLPSLVVMAGDKVLKVVKKPTTEEHVLGAIK